VKISEIFYSLQGEGGLVGMPSIFVRTSGCNLRCRWCRLKRAGMHVTIETAGTVWTEVSCDLLSISPKLKNSTPEGSFAAQHERLRIQPEVLSRLIASHEHQLKFVVAERTDLAEIKALVKTLGVPRRNVILMPEGTDLAILRERTLWVAEMCKIEGYRFTPRLHIELYGNKRGV
jgi:7-carboxy-7-deazaguanine synthase